MNKVDTKKKEIIERIVEYLWINGLSETGLRRLANVSDTSDRMLIYYFGRKDELLDIALGTIASNLTQQLDSIFDEKKYSAEILLSHLTTLMMDDAFEPAIQLWFELVGLAARKKEPFLANACIFAENWIKWIELRLDEPETKVAEDLYAHLEGRLMLKLLKG